ncbi:hypothetical protein OE749_11865 [Aestuariibacter sp. AA17]|uniref:CdiI immunity protein domain-containing protein n=1 Tax=Fluctibacter corallii TaxID=2984329 RepID=A0ABT3AAQ2_9ALTE|nr:hypothetical protein [Aestuariibacter sp. AA17]MCV2885391.1 hypothetical protein [Aestuariibacter sp. AA17]
MKYQTTTTANVAWELVNQWFDDFYHPSAESFRSSFSTDELDVLEEFDSFYDERVNTLADTLIELHKSNEWKEVVNKANWVLVTLGWKEVIAKYEDS